MVNYHSTEPRVEHSEIFSYGAMGRRLHYQHDQLLPLV